MKKFISKNWFKMLIGFSMVLVSLSFFFFSIGHAFGSGNENYYKDLLPEKNMVLVPTNPDGSLNIRLCEDQMELLKPKEQTNVVITGWYNSYKNRIDHLDISNGIPVEQVR